MSVVWNQTAGHWLLFNGAWIFAAAGAAVAAVIVAVLALVVCRGVRSRPAPLRYGLLLAGLVVLAIVPAVAVASRVAGWAAVNVPVAAVDRPLAPGPVVAAATAAKPARGPAADEEAMPLGHSAHEAAAPLRWPTLREAASCLLWIWLGGMACCVGVVIRDLVRLRRFTCSLVPCTSPVAIGLLDEAARAVGLARPPRLFESAAVPVPVVLGPANPRVVLPAGLATRLGRDKLAAVLTHETAHVVHGDLWVGLLQHAVAAVFWWCPPVRRLNRRLGEVREEICDDYVVVAQGDGFQLAEVLVEMAAGLRGRHGRLAIGALGAIDKKPALEGRVERLVNLTRGSVLMTRMNRLTVAAAMAFGAVAGAIVLATTIHGAEGPGDVLRRWKDGSLTPAEIELAVDRGLAVQADRSQAWNPAWGDFIEAVRAAGELSDDRWRQYARNAVAPKLKVRAKVRRGDPLPFRFDDEVRRGQSATHNLWFAVEIGSAEILGPRGERHDVAHPEDRLLGTLSIGMMASFFESLPDLQPGRHTLRLPWSVCELTDPSDARKQVVLAGPQVLEAEFEILPADQRTVVLRRDPKLAEAVKKAVHVEIHPFQRLGSGWSPLQGVLRTGRLPVGIGWDVFARYDGKETKIGGCARPAGFDKSGQRLSGDVPGLSADHNDRMDRVDIVLKPDPDLAASTVDVFEILDGEVVLSDIPVRVVGTAKTDPIKENL